ncbi:hypothetical protein FHS21_004164 [Phyllobacterium trifolii]|uniref:Uncharacterized protein n=1 Tax=Phyllobacterium trifolii TaxID=300193 RepID=A0A839UFZ4_9HYPH|nr:hypothetical protein [Phyllobacterium trifolii]
MIPVEFASVPGVGVSIIFQPGAGHYASCNGLQRFTETDFLHGANAVDEESVYCLML